MDNDCVISIDKVSKRYELGLGPKQGTLRDAITHTARNAWNSVFGSGVRSGPSGSFWALRDVSFSVKRGQNVAIVGRNGAGKSTLLKVLSRITEPTSGSIRMRGRVASLLEVGTGFHPELSGRENIFLNGAILGMTRVEIRRKFDEIVAFAEVDRFIDTPVKHYSSGMYVRLAFSVAAHLEPEILIVDEVLAVGDVAFQKKCLGKMKDVSQSDGRTVLFVSHNMNAVRQLCHSAVLLAAGEVKSMDTTSRVLDLYLRDSSSASPPRIPSPTAELVDKAYVEAVTMLGENGEKGDIFAVGESWCVHVCVRIKRPLDGFVAAVGIVGSDGTAIQTAWSEPMRLEAGLHEFEFNQRTFLQASGYTVIVGLSVNDVSIQQFEATRFDISGENPRGYYPVTAGAGFVLNSMGVTRRLL